MSESRLSCGVVIARETDAGWLTLLLRAYHHWDFPKGIRELGEEPMQAAIREVAEETGVTELSFDWGDRYFETGPYSRGKIARYYLAESQEGEVALPVNPELGHPEHHEFRWLSYAAARACLGGRLQAVLDWAQTLMTGKT